MHFLYDLSGENSIAGLFSAVNESIWEHQKLLFIPATIYSFLEYLLTSKRIYNYPIAAALGIVGAIFSVITVFYTYSGIIGHSIIFIDISLFYIGILIYILIRNYIIKHNYLNRSIWNTVAFMMISVLGLLFAIWTFYPPKLPLFIPEKM